MANRYILFNKPFGVLCQFSGEGRTLKDYIPITGVYAAGRLDRDSEGLILLTNDGELQHELTDPKFAHRRTYWVQVERIPGKSALHRLASGVEIQGYRTRPASVKILEQEPLLPPREPPIRFRKNVATAWLEVSLIEGRNRQVRHMTAAVGHPTLRLVRAVIGDWTLQGLKPGDWREISEQDVRDVKERLSMPRRTAH